MSRAVAKPNKPVDRVEHRRVGAGTQRAVPQPARRNALDYPLCDAAVRNTAQGAWKLADAILAECSDPGPNGARNESQAKMEAMRQEIKINHGVEYSLVWIRKNRQVASAFPPDRRRSGVSLAAHMEAGTPDVLDGLVKAEPVGTVFTVAKVRELKHPNEKDEQNKQAGEQRRQGEDQVKALQNVCRKLEQENEQLRQRYEDSSRSAGKEPEPLSPPLKPESEPSLPPVAAPPMEGQTIEKAVAVKAGAGEATGDDLDVPPFLDRRTLTDEENKQFSAMESAWSPFALALANVSPLVRHRFEVKHKVTLPTTTAEHTHNRLSAVDGDAQPVAVAAQQS
jgi:hypothetical protein